MKRLLSIIFVALVCALSASSLYAQPKSVGVRLGYYMEATYQHSLGRNFFIDANAGSSVLGDFKASSTVNGIISTFNAPAAKINLYWSAGLAMGYMVDLWNIRDFDEDYFDYRFLDHGFTFGFVPGFGAEFNFDFPLQISVDVRPVIGFHVVDTNGGSTVNFYNYGMFGFVPSVSFRYAF